MVVDIGGTTADGYCSDSTRTYAVGEPPADFRELYEVLLRAQTAQTDAVRPGVTAEELDAVGRDIITAAGYGEHFIHRTGHGIGMESHEEPYIVAGSRRAAGARHGLLDRARHLPARHASARGSRTSRCARRTAASG